VAAIAADALHCTLVSSFDKTLLLAIVVDALAWNAASIPVQHQTLDHFVMELERDRSLDNAVKNLVKNSVGKLA